MSAEPQYWLVGANWEGDDHAEAFFRRGYWELGYSDQQQPDMGRQRDSIMVGDRIAVKSMRGRGANTITIKGIGVVKEVASDKRVYIDWRLQGMNREVPAHGCFASIHGPYSVASDGEWLGQVFRI
ncbi:MAG: hypothetical protein AB7G68_20850 [Nitrospiraceae bacterium]